MIVILGENDKHTMRREIELVYPAADRPRGVRIVCRAGRPYEIDDLVRVSIASARNVIVLAGSRQPRVADQETIATALALQALPAGLVISGAVIAEINCAETQCMLRTIAHRAGNGPERGIGPHSRSVVSFSETHGDGYHDAAAGEVIGIKPSALVDALMIAHALRPSVGQALLELTSAKGSSIVSFRVPPALVAAGLTFGGTVRRFPSASVFGVQGADGHVALAPPDTRPLRKHDRLIAIVSDRPDTVRIAPVPPPPPPPPPRPLGDPLRHTIRAAPPQRMTIVLVGWSARMAQLLRTIDRAPGLASGSTVHVLASQREHRRKLELERDGIALNGEGLRRVRLDHRYGSITAARNLVQLPLATARAVLVVGEIDLDEDEDADGGAVLQIADSCALTATVLLQRVRHQQLVDVTRRVSGAASGIDNSEAQRIVTQVVDVFTKRVLERKPHIAGTGTSSVFHRNAIACSLLTMSAIHPEAHEVFKKLLGDSDDASGDDASGGGASGGDGGDASGGASSGRDYAGALVTTPASAFADADELKTMAFWDLSGRVRDACGGVLVGFRRAGINSRVVLNPKDKEAKLWQAAVLAASESEIDHGGSSTPTSINPTDALLIVTRG